MSEMRFYARVTMYSNRLNYPKLRVFSLFFGIFNYLLRSLSICSEFGNLNVGRVLVLFGFIFLIIGYRHGHNVVIVGLHPEDIHAAGVSALRGDSVDMSADRLTFLCDADHVIFIVNSKR